MNFTFYAPAAGLGHDTGFSHPENAARLKTIQSLMDESPFKTLPRGDVRPAEEDDLLRAHSLSYIERIMDAVPDRGHAAIDSDTILSPGSYEAAVHAAGAVCSAVDDIAAGKTRRAFCAVRPPGHHAEPEKSMGFCLFNNVFIGARRAQDVHGFKKVSIVDFDVHHGNGTDVMTRRHDGSIFFISSHQHPLWPMTGVEQDNDDSVMNLTLPPNSGSETFRRLYKEKLFPALSCFEPDLLMISAGFDAHRDDPLAQINLETNDYTWVTEELCKVANNTSSGRVVSVLEGGYHLGALKNCVAAHVAALAGL